MQTTPPNSSQTPTLEGFEKWFKAIPGAITAFSGGVDSSLVIVLARRFLGKQRAIACISDSPSLKRSDFQLAQDFCRSFDIQLEIIQTQEIEDAAYNQNPVNRCFACKSHLYADLSKLQERYPGYLILNGTNRDDFGDYRPGLQAASLHHALSPLADCGLDKEAVRDLARALGLPNWDKPASPCLSSRIPYGSAVTREKLSQIEAAEEIVLARGFAQVRVRHFGDAARIEVPAQDVDRLLESVAQIESKIIALGFARCEVDIEGLVSGKLNRSLSTQNHDSTL